MLEFPHSICSNGWSIGSGTGSSPNGAARVIGVVLASALLAGTGGTMSADYISRRSDMGYRFIHVESTPNSRAVSHRTPAECVTLIRNILKPTISEFASWFRVSRQTIYHWQAGAQPATEYETKLEDLAKATDVFRTEGAPISSHLLRRRIAGGKTLFEIVREGGSAEEAARQLSEVALREFRQRKMLDARLAGRKTLATIYADAGVRSFDEKS